MINDYEQELTVAGGHVTDFVAGTEYGSKPHDLGLAAAGLADPAVGEPIHVFMEAAVAVTGLTSLNIAVVGDVDGLGGTPVTLVEKDFAVAALSGTYVGQTQRVGTIGAGAMGPLSKQYLTAKLTATGNGTAGKVKVWFLKGNDVAPHNEGAVI